MAAEMLEMIRGLGDQLRWAAAADIPVVAGRSEVLVMGMGGSGIAGDVASAVTHDTPYRVSVHKGYPPFPGWVSAVSPLVVAVSYSGDTEETLACVSWAIQHGLDVVAVTSGGELAELAVSESLPLVLVPAAHQPRAAIGWLSGVVLRVIDAAGLHDDHRLRLEAAAAVADAAMTGEPWELAMGVAEALQGAVPLVRSGSPLTATAAMRWRTQLQENSKIPAFTSELPEANHNEIVGWSGVGCRFAVVDLVDHAEHDAIPRRRRHTRELTQGHLGFAGEVVSRGDSAVERLISLTAVGDVVSWRLAELSGVDPVPVAVIEDLKARLSQEQKT